MVPIYYNVRSLWARRMSTAVSVVGLALVVFVFAAVLMLSHGIEDALRAGGSPRNAVVLREGSQNEISSMIDRDAVRVLSTFPEVASSRDGAPLATGEVVVLIALPRAEGAFINATARGVEPSSYVIRSEVSIVEGRQPRPGTTEVAIGGGLVGRSKGAFVGGELVFAQTRWPVVGRIGAGGGVFESEIWVDRRKLADAFGRTALSSAVVRLGSASMLDDLKKRAEGDPRFLLKIEREDRYWESVASGTATFIRVLGLFVSIVFSGGAILGAMITMYAQVAARTRELAMMRAIGFSRRTVLFGILGESAILGATGGLLGAVCASLMTFVKIRTMNFQTFSEVRFGFSPTPGIILAALAFGLGMGILGGVLPALRAARLPILEAARA